MSGRFRANLIAASILTLWVTTAVAGVAETLHALDHQHDAHHAAEDHWQRLSQLLTHGHEHALDAPDHTHPVVSATPATLRTPRHFGFADAPMLEMVTFRGRSLPERGWLTPPARPSPRTALHQSLCVLLI